MSGCGWMIRMGDRRAETMRDYYVRRCLCSKSPDRCTKKMLSEVFGSKTLTLKPGDMRSLEMLKHARVGECHN